MELSFRDMLGVKFIIYCDNDDPDMIHAFEFNSDLDMIEFIRKQSELCPHCENNLVTSKVQIAFVKKNFEYEQGEIYG
ncbi:hypothetical protein [Domibacillus tundrae]|uniref:hypothetical protein n=1 Tax=Domibacillus tundrae TaxID=1587527 RepID=UPI000617F7AD|nr:hypothetical protein [Domibacillus tundrae]